MTRRNDSIPAGSDKAGYWLRRCHGFQVESRGRRIGVVEDILYGAEHDRPSAVLIRTGLFKHRLEAIAVSEVKAISPRSELLSLRGVGQND